ncbi:MAG: (2Fe-2S) ferredoxin domain-containing protein [bacterium]|nr:(2Fe-2S) ferredoxin domain-containing protein [bacterium]
MANKIKSIEELRKLRDQLKQGTAVREATSTRIIVGMGTCGIAAGAREVMQAILKELADRRIAANVETTSCIGMCAQEPLVDIAQAGKGRVTYGNIKPDAVPRLIDEHLVKGHIVDEWVIARLLPEGIV